MFETANLNIDSQALYNAFVYAEAHDIDLSALIESFLIQFSKGNVKDIRDRQISKEVMDLAGSLSTTASSDDWKSQKTSYLSEKYCQ